MPNITKPTNMSAVWSSVGTKTPPSDSKIAQGWVVELPPYQTANYIENRQDQFGAHVNQHGVPSWDSTTEYQGGISYTKGSNGIIYKCLTTAAGFDPINPLNSAYWTQAFETFGSVAVVAADLAALTANYGSLSGLVNVSLARTNLSVYSKLESDTRFAALNGSSAQVFNIAQATQPTHAVRLDQISGLITQATEASMGVAAVATFTEAAAGIIDTDFITPLKGKATYLMRSNNLSDLSSVPTARTNLGLGTAATSDATAFLQTANNLSDVASPSASRNNLGLGSAAVQSEAYFLRSGLNLSDVANVSLARTNLGLGNSATRNVGTTSNTVAAGDDTRIVNAVQTSRTVTAGNGLTGGGALSNNVTLTLGTPGTLSKTSTNLALADSHTHAINMASFFPTNAGGNGEVTFFNGLRFAWGSHNMNGGSNNQRVNFRIPFESYVVNVQLTNHENFDNEGNVGRVSGVDVAGFTLRNGGGNTYTTYHWFAIGV